MPKIKFYLDENIPVAVAKSLRMRGIGVLTTIEANNKSQPDDLQIEYALRESRVTVTMDRDFIRLALKYEKPHAGIIYTKPHKHGIGSFVNWLTIFYEIETAEEMMNRIEFI